MRRFYFLLSRIPEGLPSSAKSMGDFLTEEGSKIVAEQKSKRDLKESIPNAVIFVRNLMNFYDKYSHLVNTCFSAHAQFKTSLDKVLYLYPCNICYRSYNTLNRI
jgi:hypothetical protein